MKRIVKQRLIKVDGKVRTDTTYPAGFMDVITIDKTNENFQLLYDVKGRFTVHHIIPEEAKYKLGKVKRVQLGHKGIPFCVTHDGRTFFLFGTAYSHYLQIHVLQISEKRARESMILFVLTLPLEKLPSSLNLMWGTYA